MSKKVAKETSYFQERVNYLKSPIINSAFGVELATAYYKGVYMILDFDYGGIILCVCSFEDQRNGRLIHVSEDRGKAEVLEMIDLIRKDYPDKKLYARIPDPDIPLDPVMEDIYNEKGVAIYQGEGE